MCIFLLLICAYPYTSAKFRWSHANAAREDLGRSRLGPMHTPLLVLPGYEGFDWIRLMWTGLYMTCLVWAAPGHGTDHRYSYRCSVPRSAVPIKRALKASKWGHTHRHVLQSFIKACSLSWLHIRCYLETGKAILIK